MKLIKTMVFALVASLMIAACGGNAASPKAAAEEFLKASMTNDFGTMKKYVQKNGLASIESVEKQFETMKNMPQMKEQIEKAKEQTKGIKFEVLDEKIAEDGNSATVKIKASNLPNGMADQEQTLKLVKEDGSWKISDDQSDVAAQAPQAEQPAAEQDTTKAE